MPQTSLELKGSSFTLTVVHLYQSAPEVLRQALQEKIAQAPAFLKNAPVVLNVAALNGTTDWSLLQKTISDTGLKIVGISGCKDADLKHQLQQLGLPVLNEGKTRAVKRQVSEQAVQEPVVQAEIAVAELSGFSKTRIVTTPVRSGQQIYARHSDLIVTSSVSAGAELVADGNIHIYSMMRGRALAGAGGDKSAQIFCINLAAELVSVAGEYWIMDQIPAEYFGKAARLSLVDGRLAIESLN